MRDEDFELLKKTYDLKHGVQPSSDYESIRVLHSLYSSMIDPVMSQEEKDGIGHYYRSIKGRNEPAYYWILDAIYIVSRKSNTKKKFGYFVSILKNWMKYGYGYIPSDELSEIISYFEETTNTEVPDQMRKSFNELLSTFGAVGVTRMVGSLRDYDPAHAFFLLLKEVLSERYSHGKSSDKQNKAIETVVGKKFIEETVLDEQNINEIKGNDLENTANQQTRKRTKGSRWDYDKLAIKAEKFILKNGGPIKSGELFKYLDVTNGARVMAKIMEINQDIIKVGSASYTSKELDKQKDKQ